MNLSLENKLLINCSRVHLTDETAYEVENILSNHLVDWEGILKGAYWHNTAPLLYKHLNRFQENHFIPQWIMNKLKDTYHWNLARNIYLYEELKRILRLFHEKRVEVLILKGAVLAREIYGDISLRPMSDIDLLIKQKDIHVVEVVMNESGYSLRGNESLEWYKENHQHIKYVHLGKKVQVEIHWHISRKGHPSMIRVNGADIIEKWWEEAHEINFLSQRVFMLSPEALIFHLCIHFFKHRFLGQGGGFSEGFCSKGALLQLCDIYQTLKYYSDRINWAAFNTRAEEYKVRDVVVTTFSLLREFAGKKETLFPDEMTRDSDTKLVMLLAKRILTMEGALPGGFIKMQNRGIKAKTLFGELFPSREFLSEKYSLPPGSPKVYLYYIARPFILIFKYRKILGKISRIREEVFLNRWFHS